MALQKKTAFVPLGAGAQTSTDENVLPPPGLSRGINIAIEEDGSIQRSRVLSRHSTVSVLPRVNSLLTAGPHIGLITTSGYRKYEETTASYRAAVQASTDPVPPIACRIRQWSSTAVPMVSGAYADSTAVYPVLGSDSRNGMLVTAFAAEVGDGQIPTVYLMIEADDGSGRVIVPPQTLSFAAVGCAVVGTTTDEVRLVSTRGTLLQTSRIRLNDNITTTNFKHLAWSTLTTLNTTLLPWDACSAGTTTGFYVAAHQSGAGTRVFRCNSSGSKLTTSTTFSGNKGISIHASSTNGNVYVATHALLGATSIRTTVWTSALASKATSTGPNQLQSATGFASYTGLVRIALGDGYSDGVSSWAATLAVSWTGQRTLSPRCYYTHIAGLDTSAAVTETGFVFHHVVNLRPKSIPTSQGTFLGLSYAGPTSGGKGVANDSLQFTDFIVKITEDKEWVGSPPVAHSAMTVDGQSLPTPASNGVSYLRFGPVAKYNSDIAWPWLPSKHCSRLFQQGTSVKYNAIQPAILRAARSPNVTFASHLAGEWVEGAPAEVDTVKLFQVGPRMLEFTLSCLPVPICQLREEAFLSSGYGCTHDGASAFECVPHIYPEIVSVGTTGEVTTVSVYVKALSQFVDETNRVHRSAASFAATLSVLNTAVGVATTRGGVTTVDPNCLLSNTKTALGKAFTPLLYITAHDTAGPFYGCPQPADSAITYTEIGGGFLFFPIPVLHTVEPLYTDSGELPNSSPPAFHDCIGAKSRLWGVNAEVPTEIWASKYLNPSLAPEWHSALVLSTEDSPGPFVALASLDDKVIAFKTDQTFYIYGEGPNNLGGGGSFIGPTPLPTAVGCLDRKSVASGDFGVVFRGRGGIYLLDRNLAVTLISRPIQEMLFESASDSFTFVSATVTPEEGCVRWFFRTRRNITIPDTSEGGYSVNANAVRWDYIHNAWSYDYFGETGVINAVTYQGRPLILGDTGLVYRPMFREEYPIGQFPYASASEFETGWINLESLNGFNRCYNIVVHGKNLESNADDDLRFKVELYFDGDEVTYAESYDTHLNALSTDLRVEIKPARRKFRSLKLRIKELQDETTSQGWVRFHGISIEYGTKVGSFPYFKTGQRQ